ncbi:hypothetical protein BGZ95_007127 [Linnemannia exigua]|uniref:Uncharacterized protein n=1 Tax=Linnemannia exigua TaxID=604196 RepID=A0AAD4H811_9FUNG|nr:hypothetical protein BGZ95_007127 [Linnemannia exigua]
MPVDPTTAPNPVTRTTAKPPATKTTAVPVRPTTVRTTTVRASRTPTISTTAAVISPTPTPEPPGGLAPGAIGGIAGGAVALVALVGVVFYKRRKRTIAAASKSGGGIGKDNKDEPIYMHASNYSSNNHKNPPPNNGISGPLALSAESDFNATPSPFRRPSQQQQGQREDDFHREPSGAGPYVGPGDSKNNNLNNNQHSQFGNDNNRNNHNGRKSEQDDRNNSHSPHDDKAPLQNDYYDVQDYYDGPQEPIGAQRSVVSPRDVTHGNLTPAPEYYLGKEDIDPRRDLRGLDEPETYIRKASMMQAAPVDQKQRDPRHRRSSVSSDGGSTYMTLEQAQQAHQKKMQGHKESIGSVSMLIDTSNKNKQPHRSEEPRSPGTPTVAHDNASIAISDSTMSMMPSLPPINSPMPFSGHDDPYAESAFSEDFSSYPNSPHYPAPYKGAHPSQQQPYPQHYPPYSPGGYGPGGGNGGGYPQQGGNGFRGNGYGPGSNHGGYPGSPPYNGGYGGGGGGRPQRGPTGHSNGNRPAQQGWNGPGYGPPGPGGRGPGYGPQNGYNGYPPRGASPGPGGYRQHPSQQQRDPYYGRAY